MQLLQRYHFMQLLSFNALFCHLHHAAHIAWPLCSLNTILWWCLISMHNFSDKSSTLISFSEYIKVDRYYDKLMMATSKNFLISLHVFLTHETLSVKFISCNLILCPDFKWQVLLQPVQIAQCYPPFTFFFLCLWHSITFG